MLKYVGRALVAVDDTAVDVRLYFVAFKAPAHALLAACIMATVYSVSHVITMNYGKFPFYSVFFISIYKTKVYFSI